MEDVVHAWTLAVLLNLAAPAAPAPAEAEEPLLPSDYIAIMEKSPLVYELGVEVGDGVPRLTCGERHSEQRVVTAAGERSLVAWIPRPEAVPHAEAAERHFNANDLAAADREYAALLALDPDYGPGWLFRGDVPFHRGDYEAALSLYRKALELDPTLPQAHRFAADALRRLGRLEEAEEAYVQALAWNPGYSEALDSLEALGRVRGFRVQRFEWPFEARVAPPDAGRVRVGLSASPAPGELAYAACHAVWSSEPEFVARAGSGPGTWSAGIERACVLAAAAGAWVEVEGAMREAAAARGSKREPTRDEILARVDPWVGHLMAEPDPRRLDGFTYFVVGGGLCPIAASLVPDEIHAAIADYVRDFVIVRSAPARPEEGPAP